MACLLEAIASWYSGVPYRNIVLCGCVGDSLAPIVLPATGSYCFFLQENPSTAGNRCPLISSLVWLQVRMILCGHC
jgi:hypothetical protein